MDPVTPRSDARNDALRLYAAAFDRLAEVEQVAVAVGQYDTAGDAHVASLVALRAYRAELDDPEPRETCACPTCLLAHTFRRVT